MASKLTLQSSDASAQSKGSDTTAESKGSDTTAKK